MFTGNISLKFFSYVCVWNKIIKFKQVGCSFFNAGELCQSIKHNERNAEA